MHDSGLGLLGVTFCEFQKLCYGEWFGDESGESFFGDQSSVEVGNERRAENSVNSRIDLFQQAKSFDTVHVGHEHVENYQVDFFTEFRVNVHRFGSVGALGDVVSLRR